MHWWLVIWEPLFWILNPGQSGPNCPEVHHLLNSSGAACVVNPLEKVIPKGSQAGHRNWDVLNLYLLLQILAIKLSELFLCIKTTAVLACTTNTEFIYVAKCFTIPRLAAFCFIQKSDSVNYNKGKNKGLCQSL